MSAEQYFDGTCETLDLRECPDKLQDVFLDPCSCKGYWQCTNTFSTKYKICSDNTLYNYITGRCDHERDVSLNQPCQEGVDTWIRCNDTEICGHEKDVSFNQPCQEGVNSWIRCNDTISAARLLELQAYCTNTTITTEGMPAATPTSSTDPSSGVNVGMVVGPSIAGAVVALVIVALVIMCRHRKSKLKRKARRTSSTSSEYVEGRIADDSYAVIDDRMTNPQYIGNSNAGFTHDLNGTMSTTTTTLPHEDRSIYDDSVAPIDNYGYTSPLARERNDEQEPYDKLATISENEANSAASANQHGGTGKSKLVNHIESNENNTVIMESDSDTGYEVPSPPIAVSVVENEPTDNKTNENTTVITESDSDTGYEVPSPPIAVSVVENEPTDNKTNENTTVITDSDCDAGYEVPSPPIAVSAVDN